jgi:hypothetical protein
MSHLLDNLVSIAVDNDHLRGWGGTALAKLRDVRADDAVISCAFFDPHITVPANDPLGRRAGDGIVTKGTIDEWASYGRIAGLRIDPSWLDWPAPEDAAKWASDQIARFDEPGKRRIQVVEYDVETHNVAWQIHFLLGYISNGVRVKGIRGCGGDYPDPTKPWTLGWRWNRPGVYTFEGRQTVETSAGDVASRCGLKIAPQLYNGAMTEVWDAQREFRYWCGVTGVSPGAFTVYSDARREHRPKGIRDQILFATTRLTELYE